MITLLGEPTVTFCEKAISGLIRRPWYAVSDLAYLFVGLYILRKAGHTLLGSLFGFLALTVGSLSLIYDSTYMRVTQLFDISGMIMFVGLLIFLSLNALYAVSIKRYLLYAIPALLAIMLATYYLGGQSGNIIFGVLVLAVLFLEYQCYIKKIHQNYSAFIIGLVLISVGFGLWLTDSTKLLCFNLGLLNGRAIFHYLTAITIYQLYLFYASQKTTPALK